MNYGIIQNRRHDKRRDGAPNPLLQDARLREMAKQMGLDAKDLGDESAQNLWQLLDDMAANDPNAYQRFIQEQLQHGPPQPAASSTDAASSNQHTHEDKSSSTPADARAQAKSTAPPVLLPRYFAPYPGFVVKCVMLHSIKCQQQETKLFLNCCAHEIVDVPKNPNSGNDVPADTRAVPSTSNLEVPLVVGKVREVHDAAGSVCCACDVVFHPWVMRRCEWDANFKREVMKLAIHWAQQDARVRLVHQVGKFIKSRYKGGSVDADGDIVTTKFLVEPPSAHSDKTNDGAAPSTTSGRTTTSASPNQSDGHAAPAMESPSELLKQVRLTRNEQDADSSLAKDFVIQPARTESTKTSIATGATTSASHQKPKSKLIEELGPASSLPPPAPVAALAATAKTRAKKPTGGSGVKKGFLLSSAAKVKALYPTGSTEGHAPSPYVKLLSRSKVVDLSDVERQKQAQEAQRKQVQDEFAFLDASANSSKSSASQTLDATARDEVDCGDFEFEQLCMDADPDLNPRARHQALANSSTSGASSDPMRQLFGDNFDEFSKLLNM